MNVETAVMDFVLTMSGARIAVVDRVTMVVDARAEAMIAGRAPLDAATVVVIFNDVPFDLQDGAIDPRPEPLDDRAEVSDEATMRSVARGVGLDSGSMVLDFRFPASSGSLSRPAA